MKASQKPDAQEKKLNTFLHLRQKAHEGTHRAFPESNLLLTGVMIQFLVWSRTYQKSAWGKKCESLFYKI